MQKELYRHKKEPLNHRPRVSDMKDVELFEVHSDVAIGMSGTVMLHGNGHGIDSHC
jgi:hypothetical protein